MTSWGAVQRSATTFGVFFDIGAAKDGLCHVSQLVGPSGLESFCSPISLYDCM